MGFGGGHPGQVNLWLNAFVKAILMFYFPKNFFKWQEFPGCFVWGRTC